jgi:hypothetical protein
VISVSWTGCASVTLLTAAVGLGAIAESIAAVCGVSEARQRQRCGRWMWLAAAVILVVSAIWFWRVYTWTCEEFPDGHVISQVTPAWGAAVGPRPTFWCLDAAEAISPACAQTGASRLDMSGFTWKWRTATPEL